MRKNYFLIARKVPKMRDTFCVCFTKVRWRLYVDMQPGIVRHSHQKFSFEGKNFRQLCQQIQKLLPHTIIEAQLFCIPFRAQNATGEYAFAGLLAFRLSRVKEKGG